jgi:hypothetical protein
VTPGVRRASGSCILSPCLAVPGGPRSHTLRRASYLPLAAPRVLRPTGAAVLASRPRQSSPMNKPAAVRQGRSCPRPCRCHAPFVPLSCSIFRAGCRPDAAWMPPGCRLCGARALPALRACAGRLGATFAAPVRSLGASGCPTARIGNSAL